MVSGHPKSTGILRADGLSTGPPDLGCHIKEKSLKGKTFFLVNLCI